MSNKSEESAAANTPELLRKHAESAVREAKQFSLARVYATMAVEQGGKNAAKNIVAEMDATAVEVTGLFGFGSEFDHRGADIPSGVALSSNEEEASLALAMYLADVGDPEVCGSNLVRMYAFHLAQADLRAQNTGSRFSAGRSASREAADKFMSAARQKVEATPNIAADCLATCQELSSRAQAQRAEWDRVQGEIEIQDRTSKEGEQRERTTAEAKERQLRVVAAIEGLAEATRRANQVFSTRE